MVHGIPKGRKQVVRRGRKQRMIEELHHIHITADDMMKDLRRTYFSAGMLDWSLFETEVIEVSEKLHKLYHSMPALEAESNSPDPTILGHSKMGGSSKEEA